MSDMKWEKKKQENRNVNPLSNIHISLSMKAILNMCQELLKHKILHMLYLHMFSLIVKTQ